MGNIFDQVVRNENDHTALLKNLFERDPQVAAAILNRYLHKNILPEQAARFDYELQPRFSGVSVSGISRVEIPDLTISGRDLWCVVEAKVDPFLDLEEAQHDGYPACFKRRSGQLWFITPKSALHEKRVPTVRATAQGPVTHTHWDELVLLLKETCNPEDAISQEILRFWSGRFQPMQIDSRDLTVFRNWKQEVFVAARKAEKLVDQTKLFFDGRHDAYSTELETSVDQYGFYLKDGKTFILWFGIWNSSKGPFAMGFSTKEAKWRLPNPMQIPEDMYEAKDGYKLCDLSESGWESAEAAFAEVNQLLILLGHEAASAKSQG